jgi:hypothetical protein
MRGAPRPAGRPPPLLRRLPLVRVFLCRAPRRAPRSGRRDLSALFTPLPTSPARPAAAGARARAGWRLPAPAPRDDWKAFLRTVRGTVPRSSRARLQARGAALRAAPPSRGACPLPQCWRRRARAAARRGGSGIAAAAVAAAAVAVPHQPGGRLDELPPCLRVLDCAAAAAAAPRLPARAAGRRSTRRRRAGRARLDLLAHPTGLRPLLPPARPRRAVRGTRGARRLVERPSPPPDRVGGGAPLNPSPGCPLPAASCVCPRATRRAAPPAPSPRPRTSAA